MGRRARRRARGEAGPPTATSDYADADGNVLRLRDRVSEKSAAALRASGARPGASAEDRWQRQAELLFERLAVSWEIAGLPLTGQRELLGRYRMADTTTREWVRATLRDHVGARQPELLD